MYAPAPTATDYSRHCVGVKCSFLAGVINSSRQPLAASGDEPNKVMCGGKGEVLRVPNGFTETVQEDTFMAASKKNSSSVGEIAQAFVTNYGSPSTSN